MTDPAGRQRFFAAGLTAAVLAVEDFALTAGLVEAAALVVTLAGLPLFFGTVVVFGEAFAGPGLRPLFFGAEDAAVFSAAGTAMETSEEAVLTFAGRPRFFATVPEPAGRPGFLLGPAPEPAGRPLFLPVLDDPAGRPGPFFGAVLAL